MRTPTSREDHPAKQFFQRVNRVAGELNAFLVIIAIGLGVLDLTCLYALTIERALPPITQVSCPATPGSHPATGGSAVAMPK